MALTFKELWSLGYPKVKKYFHRVKEAQKKIEEVISQYPDGFVAQKIRDILHDLETEERGIERIYNEEARRRLEAGNAQSTITYVDWGGEHYKPKQETEPDEKNTADEER